MRTLLKVIAIASLAMCFSGAAWAQPSDKTFSIAMEVNR